MENSTKNLTIRIPADLWRKLKLMQIDGEIKSINQAANDGLRKIVRENITPDAH